MDFDSLDYLEPGFDPKSLTIPRLRSILVAHNVPYNSSAKKGQLVDIFNEQLLPQANKILAARARAKRTSKGIFDADSSQSQSSNPFDEHDDLQPPPPRAPSARRSRSPRKTSARVKSEEPEYDQPAPIPPAMPSPSKRKSRASSRQPDTYLAPQPVDEDAAAASIRRTRRSATPKIKTEDSNDGLFRRTSDVFTQENPFQSGSSPTGAAPEKSPVDRRRSSARASVDPYRRQTGGSVISAGSRSSMPRDFGEPLQDMRRQKTPQPALSEDDDEDEDEDDYEDNYDVMEAGEEFTPEEQLELDAVDALHGGGKAVGPRKPRPAAPSTNWSTPLSVMFLTLLAVYAGWFRQEKILVGYCNIGQGFSSIPTELPTPEWAQAVLPAEVNVPAALIDAVEPRCEPCPPHARCYEDFSVECESGYILKPHPFALWGVVPLPPTCEPDGEVVLKVKSMVDRAVEELRERTAHYECGDVDEEGAKLVDTPTLEEDQLKEIIDKKRNSKKMSDDEFQDLWGSAIGEIKARDEVKVETAQAQGNNGTHANTVLSSTSLARVPFKCAIRRSIRLGLARYRLPIASVIGLIVAILYGRARFQSNRKAAAQVPALVDLVLERLANQKELGEEGLDDSWLFLPNLRDDVLRSVHSLSQREKMWRRVRAVVEQNSNVRTGQREGRSGEVGRAWEWIGPTSSDASATRRRRSGRMSWGPDVADRVEESPAGASAGVSTPGSEDRSYLHKKWEESRPVY